eukprot:1895026-Amphidinium_carterae.1
MPLLWQPCHWAMHPASSSAGLAEASRQPFGSPLALDSGNDAAVEKKFSAQTHSQATYSVVLTTI